MFDFFNSVLDWFSSIGDWFASIGDFFTNIIDYIALFWDWFIGGVRAMGTIFSMLLSFQVPITWMTGVLPTMISTCMIIVIAISVVKAIFGR